MSNMIMEIELPDNCAAVLEGNRIKYWIGEGLPVFTGTLDCFALAYPRAFERLINLGVVK